MMADAVSISSHTLSQYPYAEFNAKIAKSVVLEAGVMLQADAILVWGRWRGPCATAGDPS